MGCDILICYIMAEKICSYPLCDSISNPFPQEQAMTRASFGIPNEDYVMLMSYSRSKHRNQLAMSEKEN